MNSRIAIERIQQYCLLVTLHVRAWTGQPQIDGASVLVGEEQITDVDTTLPRWKLLPKGQKAKFQQLEKQARSLIKSVSVPFKLRGVYIVPLVEADELFKQLHDVKKQYQETVDEFLNNYDGWLEELRNSMAEQNFTVVRKCIPSKYELKRMFAIEWAVLPIGHPAPTAVNIGTTDLIREAYTNMGALIMESYNNMIRQPFDELNEAATGLATALSGTTSVRRPTVTKFEKAVKKYRNFANIVGGNQDVLLKLNDIERVVDFSAPLIGLNRDQNLRQELAEILSNLETADS